MSKTKAYERVRHYIKSNGMMFKFVAEKSDIKEKRFLRLMNGKAPLVVDEFEVICRNGLQMDPGYFFNQFFLDFKNVGDKA